MSQNVLSLSNITKTYYGAGSPVHALQGVSFSLAEGEMVAIMGPSGSIRDNQSDQNNHNNLHFPVLIGDYIYGTLLRRLCDLGCIEILPDLGAVICDINEGAMRRDELSVSGGSPLDYMSAIRQEYGSAFRQAALTGMWLAGGDSDLADTYSEMANYIGTIIGIEQVGMDPDMAKTCRRESLDLYNKLDYGSTRRVAQHLLRYAGIERKKLRAASGQ